MIQRDKSLRNTTCSQLLFSCPPNIGADSGHDRLKGKLLIFHEDIIESAVEAGVDEVGKAEVEDEDVCHCSHRPIVCRETNQVCKLSKYMVLQIA